MADDLLTECRTCKHWAEDLSFPNPGQKRIGTCRRYPPVIVVAPPNISPMRPMTEIDDTCGEHKMNIGAN